MNKLVPILLVADPQPSGDHAASRYPSVAYGGANNVPRVCPLGRPGDRLTDSTEIVSVGFDRAATLPGNPFAWVVEFKIVERAGL